jgi:hypothetical protein
MADFTSQQLASGKWGIYSDSRLLATVNSHEICETVILNLSSGRKDVPANDVDALYQVPLLRNSSDSRSSTEKSSGQSGLLDHCPTAPSEPKPSPDRQSKLRNQPAVVKANQKSRKKAKVGSAS